jgi:hypothetical protein
MRSAESTKLLKILTGAIAFSLIVATAGAATPKSGTKCSKAGATYSSNNSKYKCVKKSGKLVWSKVNKQASKTPVPTTTPGVKTLSTQEKTILELEKAMILGPKKEFIRYHFSPKAVDSFKSFLVKDLDTSMRYWFSVYDNPEPFNVFYGTETELDWMIDAWRPYGFDKNTGFADDLRGRIAREGSNLNAGAVPSASGSSHLSILRHTSKQIQSGDFSFIAHESTHIIQQYLSKSNTSQMPCWLREGSANVFGAFLATKLHNTDYGVLKRQHMNNYLWGSSGIDVRSFNAEQWLSHIKELEGNFSGTCDYVFRFAYGTGHLISEALIAEFGFNKMIDFWRSFGGAKQLRLSFLEIYGLELDTWYKLVAIPYVMDQYLSTPRQ